MSMIINQKRRKKNFFFPHLESLYINVWKPINKKKKVTEQKKNKIFSSWRKSIKEALVFCFNYPSWWWWWWPRNGEEKNPINDPYNQLKKSYYTCMYGSYYIECQKIFVDFFSWIPIYLIVCCWKYKNQKKYQNQEAPENHENDDDDDDDDDHDHHHHHYYYCFV